MSMSILTCDFQFSFLYFFKFGLVCFSFCLPCLDFCCLDLFLIFFSILDFVVVVVEFYVLKNKYT